MSREMEGRGEERRWALWLLGCPAAFAFIGTLVRTFRRYNNKIIMAHTPGNDEIVRHCPAMVEYKPTPWLPGPHLNTLFASMFRSSPGLKYSRVMLEVGDGAFVAVDWHTLPQLGQPVLVLQHGLTGGSEERYVQWMVKAATERLHLCCVVMNARGCSTSALMTPQSFSAAWTEDYRRTVEYVRSVIGEGPPIFGIGYSLGGGILTKYCCEEGKSCPLAAAIACCPSFDQNLSAAHLERPLNRIVYNRALARNLGRFMKRHQHHFIHEDWIDLDKAYEAKTIREFDEATIVPMFRYRDVEHYYSDASTCDRVEEIEIPYLSLNAEDDPICTAAGVPVQRIPKNPHLIAVLTSEGGHVAWCQGWWPSQFTWENDVVCQYISAILAKIHFSWDSRIWGSLCRSGSRPLDVRPASLRQLPQPHTITQGSPKRVSANAISRQVQKGSLGLPHLEG